ncbi:MAG: CotH kinase family protein [Firmicutes bacterium]|nr:CotH kinase family protein [Bacillota bacterium]MCM1476765.1 CotH kinase family protein [Bacteroides sp.]
MKKLFLSACCAFFMAAGVHAQNQELYLFRNDKNFDYFKLDQIKDITYSGGTAGFNKVTVTTMNDAQSVSMDVVDSVVVRQTAIPDIYVNLTDYPDITDLFKTGGFTKSTIYAATLRMDGNGMYDDLPEQTVEFRGRGNSTWNFAKTPYRFKMSKKTSVCGMKKAKTFALIANYIDPSLMRNAISLWTANELGLPFSNHSIPVNMYLNGHYKGAYIITEKIGTGSGSVDIDEATGMLFELDSNYDEDFKFTYTFANNNRKRLPVMVKDPDLTEVKADASERQEYFRQWTNDFTEMANVVVNPGTKKLADYIDLKDAAAYVLVNSLACNKELCHPKSLYIHKEGLGKDYLYHFGPVWDFDWSYGYDGLTIINYNRGLFDSDGDYAGGSFMKALVSNKEFQEVYKEVWDNFYKEIYPRLLVYIDEYARMIEPSARRDGLLWPDAYASGYALAESAFDTKKKVGDLKTWLMNRVEWCNQQSNWGLY